MSVPTDWLDHHVTISEFTADSLLLSLGGLILAAIMVERAGRLIGDTIASVGSDPVGETRAALAAVRKSMRETSARREEYLRMGQDPEGPAITLAEGDLTTLGKQEETLAGQLHGKRWLLRIGDLVAILLALAFAIGGLRVFAVIGVEFGTSLPTNAPDPHATALFHFADIFTSTALILGGGEGVRALIERFSGIAEKPLNNVESGRGDAS